MKNTLTLKEQATNAETWEHIHRVGTLLNHFIRGLMDRAEIHDRSKLHSPEVEIFAKYGSKLKDITYGSDVYKTYVEDIDVGLTHHYEHNRHHPEHFKNGVGDMNLLDIVEMFCDWIAAGERHEDGSIEKSIEFNKDRFNLSPQLVRIFQNTAWIATYLQVE